MTASRSTSLIQQGKVSKIVLFKTMTLIGKLYFPILTTFLFLFLDIYAQPKRLEANFQWNAKILYALKSSLMLVWTVNNTIAEEALCYRNLSEWFSNHFIMNELTVFCFVLFFIITHCKARTQETLLSFMRKLGSLSSHFVFTLLG